MQPLRSGRGLDAGGPDDRLGRQDTRGGSDAVGIAGGALVSVALLGLNASSYFHNSYRALQYGDVVQGLTKPLFSGFIIATVGCYFGMTTKGGTQGVGKATTQAVVYSSVFIIIVDFIVSRAMIGIFGR